MKRLLIADFINIGKTSLSGVGDIEPNEKDSTGACRAGCFT